MAPKTKSRTGIWYFAKECMDNGKLNCNSVKEGIEAIYPEWKAMVAHEKGPYERKCQDWRNEIKGTTSIKSESKIKPEYMDPEDDQPTTQELENFLENLSTAKKENTDEMSSIKSQHWYFIKFQTFCKCDVNPDPQYNYKPYFVLAEVALVEYSLQDGIIKEYQAFIKPNKVPLGYTSQCMERSKEEHQIPLHSFDKITKSHEEIYSDIKNFLQPKSENNYFASVFCMAEDMQETYFGLKYLHNQSSEHNDFSLKKIFDLETLVVLLAKHCSVDYSIGSTRDLLTSYAFDYTPKSRCPFHENLGINCTYCSLGMCKKSAFLISDNICQFYEIALTPKHVPVQQPVATVVYNNGSRNSGYGSNSSYRNSSNSLNSHRNSSNYINSSSDNNNRNKRQNYEENNDDDSEVRSNSSSINSRISTVTVTSSNMPSVDIRRAPRQLVSDKFERASYVSTSKSVVSDSIDSNISSGVNRYQNARDARDLHLMEEEDDENEWTTVEKGNFSKARKFVDQEDTMSVGSNVTSSLTEKTNDNDSLKNSSTKSFMGRGRAMSRR